MIPDPAPCSDKEDSGCRTAPTDDTAVCHASAAEDFFTRSVNHSRLSHALSFAVDPLVVCVPDVNFQHLGEDNQGCVLACVADR